MFHIVDDLCMTSSSLRMKLLFETSLAIYATWRHSILPLHHLYSGMYDVNLCPKENITCKPCNERLPSCVDLPNGNNAISGRLWTAKYVVCLQNRTLELKRCAKGLFDPNTRACSETVDPSKWLSTVYT